MDIEKQVCSLEQAKKLKDLGIDQHQKTFAWVQDESPFYSKNDVPDFFVAYADGYSWTEYPGYADYKVIFAAFTVAELSVMLPPFSNAGALVKVKQKTKWAAFYHDFTLRNVSMEEGSGDTEAIALANLLVVCLSTSPNIITGVNERLAS